MAIDESYGSPDVFYRDYYSRLIGNDSRAVRMVHRTMERPLRGRHFPVVLELGSGNGEHRQHVRHTFDQYLTLDLRIEGKPDVVADAMALPIANESIDRLVAMCLLMHLPDPEAALEEWRRVVRPGGLASIYVPCDPGLAMRTIRRLTTIPAARRLGYQGYELMIAREHVNTVSGLDRMMRWVFRDDEIRLIRRPARLPSWNLNAFYIYHIEKQVESV